MELPTHGDPTKSQFTCNTCNVKFPQADLQRRHMKSDWHRYNLKRRVADLPLITSEAFAEKVLAAKQLEDYVEEDEYGFHLSARDRRRFEQESGDSSVSTIAINTSGRGGVSAQGQRSVATPEAPKPTRRASQASVASQLSEFSLGTDVDYPTDDTGSVHYDTDEFSEITYESDEFELVTPHQSNAPNEYSGPEQCVFCPKKFDGVEPNVRHMFKEHGLYVPERSYLSDLGGLLAFLAEQVWKNLNCLLCGFNGRNLELLWQHMSNKGHCRIPYELKEDKRRVGAFYTFYDDEEPVKPRGGQRVAFSEDTTEDNGENVLEDTPSDLEDNGINDNYQLVHIDNQGEMLLPNGTVLGTRNLNRQYRQRQPALALISARPSSEGDKTVALADRRMAPGLTTHVLTKQEVESRRVEQQKRNQYLRREKGPKINYQKHFRDEMLQ